LKSLSLIEGFVFLLAAFFTGVVGFSFFTGDFLATGAFLAGTSFLTGLGIGVATGLFFTLAFLAGAFLVIALDAWRLGAAFLVIVVSILFYFKFRDVFTFIY
jgi:hypothetical protein